MKATIEVQDALLEEAKRVAREEGTTLRALVEAGLRAEVRARRRRSEFKLRDVSFRGKRAPGRVPERGLGPDPGCRIRRSRRMIAVDTNVLEGRAHWAIPWPCLHEFLAIVTHPRIFDRPTPQPSALDQAAAWMESPSLIVLGEADDHWDQLSSLLQTSEVVGPRVHDARVAAICRSHGVSELWSVDREFSRFPDLPVSNPLHRH